MGYGVSKDLETALLYYKAAADQGNADAQASLGYVHLKNHRPTEALKYLRLACQQNSKEALFYVGKMYQAGVKVPKDNHAAFGYFLRAADRDDPHPLALVQVAHGFYRYILLKFFLSSIGVVHLSFAIGIAVGLSQKKIMA